MFENMRTQQNKIIRDVTSWDPTREKKVCKLFRLKKFASFSKSSQFKIEIIPDELRNIIKKVVLLVDFSIFEEKIPVLLHR